MNRSLQEVWSLRNLSVQTVDFVQLHIEIFTWCESERLFITDTKYAKFCKAFVDQAVYAFLQTTIEINHHVSAKNDVEFVKRSVGDKIVFRKHDIQSK